MANVKLYLTVITMSLYKKLNKLLKQNQKYICASIVIYCICHLHPFTCTGICTVLKNYQSIHFIPIVVHCMRLLLVITN